MDAFVQRSLCKLSKIMYESGDQQSMPRDEYRDKDLKGKRKEEEEREQTSSKKPHLDPNSWRTPKYIYDFLTDPDGANLHIVGDACASAENKLHPRYLTEEDNAMKVDWQEYFDATTCCHAYDAGIDIDYIFGNVPFGKDKHGNELNDWFRKFSTVAHNGVGVVALVPAPAGEKYRWGKYVYGKASKIYDVQGRVKFGNPLDGSYDKPANFGVQLVVWDPIALCEKHRSKEKIDTVIGPFYP